MYDKTFRFKNMINNQHACTEYASERAYSHHVVINIIPKMENTVSLGCI